jgi:hypothetical protein
MSGDSKSQVGKKVKVHNLRYCGCQDWGMTDGEYETLLQHEGQEATVTSLEVETNDDRDYCYYAIKFDDGYEVNNISSYHFVWRD